MLNGEDWLLRPTLEGLCRYESLKDCSIGLADILRMHEALDVRDENLYRLRKDK